LVLACGALLPGLAASQIGQSQHRGVASFYDHFNGMQIQDQEGRPLNAHSFSGRATLVSFVFTGCSTTCPIQARLLADLQQSLSPDVKARFRLLSVSLDPLGDTPAALKSFAGRVGADLKSWTFVTGRPHDIDRLSKALRLFREGAGSRSLEDHSTALWLVDARGQVRAVYSGNPPDIRRLANEIVALDRVTRAKPA
jgi:cytochrome oxidase Cu insertion factor (SCO1/SenC/PrrC family)